MAGAEGTRSRGRCLELWSEGRGEREHTHPSVMKAEEGIHTQELSHVDLYSEPTRGHWRVLSGAVKSLDVYFSE